MDERIDSVIFIRLPQTGSLSTFNFNQLYLEYQFWILCKFNGYFHIVWNKVPFYPLSVSATFLGTVGNERIRRMQSENVPKGNLERELIETLLDHLQCSNVILLHLRKSYKSIARSNLSRRICKQCEENICVLDEDYKGEVIPFQGGNSVKNVLSPF